MGQRRLRVGLLLQDDQRFGCRQRADLDGLGRIRQAAGVQPQLLQHVTDFRPLDESDPRQIHQRLHQPRLPCLARRIAAVAQDDRHGMSGRCRLVLPPVLRRILDGGRRFVVGATATAGQDTKRYNQS